MADPPNIQSILAALTAQASNSGGVGNQTQNPLQSPHHTQHPGLPQGYPNPPSATLAGYSLPQPTNSGSLDLSSIKPVNSGTVSIADAIAKARGIAAEKGVSYDPSGRIGTPNRESDSRGGGRPYGRRSRSRSPPPARRDAFRDNYNPYRDERRDDRRSANGRDVPNERHFSPGLRDRRDTATTYSPPDRGYGGRGDRSPQGRSGADDNQEMIQIDSSLVGLIIGRQGENLRRVENDTGARVQFITGPDISGPKRDCKISGTLRARQDAKAEISRIIEDNGRNMGVTSFDRGGRGGSGPPPNPAPGLPGSHQPALRDGEDSMQIMVPDRTVGLIIGRGGETIRDLQERSGCHVNIVGEQKSVNGLRPVNLIGTPQAAALAKNLIMEIVDSDTKSMANQGPGPSRDLPRQGAYGGQGSASGMVGNSFGGGDRINDSIYVPSGAVGMIIGKGGETIKDMQNQSGCKINVSQQTRSDEVERQIGLVGTRDAIERAKRLIEEKVDVVRGSGGSRTNDSFNDRSHSDRFSQNQQVYGQPQGQASQAPPVPQVQGASPGAPDAPDPYAAYGGYNNYVAMWYAALAQQQQQPGQGQGEQQGPPGTA